MSDAAPARWRPRRVELGSRAPSASRRCVSPSTRSGACRTIYVGDSGELVTAVVRAGHPAPLAATRSTCCWASCGRCCVPLGSIAFRMSLFSAACAAAAVRGALPPVPAGAGLRPRPRPPRRCCWPSPRASGARPTCSASTRSTRCSCCWRRLARASRGAATGATATLLARLPSCAAWAPPTTPSWASWRSPSASSRSATSPPLLQRRRLLAGCAALRSLAGLLPYALPAAALAHGPAPRLGQPGDAGRLPAASSCAATSGTGAGSRGRRTCCRSPPTTCGASARSCSGWARRWRCWALVVGPARRWPVLLPLLIMARQRSRRWPCTARAPTSSSGTATTSRPTPWARCSPGMGLADAARAAAARARAAAAPLACPLVGARLGLARVRPQPLPRSRRTSRARCWRRCRPGAHLAATDDNILFVLMYLKLVEGLRPDVDLILQGVGGASLPAAALQPRQRCRSSSRTIPNWRIAQLEVVPVGLVFQIARAGGPPPPAAPAQGRPGGRATTPRCPRTT